MAVPFGTIITIYILRHIMLISKTRVVIDNFSWFSSSEVLELRWKLTCPSVETGRGSLIDDRSPLTKKEKKHRQIAKECPEYILSVVKVSSCSCFFSFVRNYVWSEFEFLSFVRICFFFVLSQFVSDFYHNFSCWVLSQF